MKQVSLKIMTLFLVCILAGLFLSACNEGGSDSNSQGTLSTSLTDKSTDEYQAIYVTIARVDVHHDGNDTWQTVASPNHTYNLLELVNNVRKNLGITSLDTGHYTQMRLIIGETPDDGINILSVSHPFANYLIDLNDDTHELKVPSGTNTGLKVVNGFDINENQTTELILDFDAMSSVVKAGSSGNYQLKPTVKVLNAVDYGIAFGTVTEAGATPAVPLEGSFVMAQTADLVIDAGTVTDENGEYALFLAPGTYNLVATQPGYFPVCHGTTLDESSMPWPPIDFSLPADTALPGTISGLVTITDATDAMADQYVTIDIRQELDCGGTGTQAVTVKSINIANGGTYSIELPAGSYEVVASTYDKVTQSTVTQSATVTVFSDATATNPITFILSP